MPPKNKKPSFIYIYNIYINVIVESDGGGCIQSMTYHTVAG